MLISPIIDSHVFHEKELVSDSGKGTKPVTKCLGGVVIFHLRQCGADPFRIVNPCQLLPDMGVDGDRFLMIKREQADAISKLRTYAR